MNNLGLLIFIFLVVVPPILQAINRLREKAKAEQMRQQRTRAHREAIRSGRQESAVVQQSQKQAMPARVEANIAAEDRLRQLERDRQARLRELRARASGASRTGGQGAAGQRTPPAARAPQARPAQQRSPRQPAARPRVVAAAPGQRPSSRPTARATPPISKSREAEQPAHPSLALERTEIGATRPRSTEDEPAKVIRAKKLRLNRNSLRQAVVLSEILSPPVSMRENAGA